MQKLLLNHVVTMTTVTGILHNRINFHILVFFKKNIYVYTIFRVDVRLSRACKCVCTFWMIGSGLNVKGRNLLIEQMSEWVKYCGTSV